MISIEKASIEALDDLAAMAKTIWLNYYIDIIGIDQIQYMLNKFYSQEALLEQIKNNQQFHFIVYNQQSIGFIAYTIQNDKTCFINKYYLLSEYQGKSYGSKCLYALEKQIQIENSNTISAFKLTVNRQNFKSINFYFKNGFTIETVADFDIGNGFVMNDFIMKKLIVTS